MSWFSFSVKLLWRAGDCWNESLKLIHVAEDAECSKVQNMESQEHVESMNSSIIMRRLVLTALSCGPFTLFLVTQGAGLINALQRERSCSSHFS